MNYELVFFDLDGTLFDTLIDITNSVNYMLERFNKSPLSKDLIRNYIGDGAKTLIERVLKNYDISINEGLDLFISYYSNNYLANTKPYDRVVETLKKLGTINIVLTNKPLKIAEDIIKKHKLVKYFKLVIGPETFGIKKPDPMAIFEVSKKFNISLDKCLLVGDSSIDIECAKNANIFCCCVSYGYGSYDDISKADKIIENFDEILKIL